MKITSIDVYPLSYKLKKDEIWEASCVYVDIWNYLIVKVNTDEGIYGLGESGGGHYIPKIGQPIVDFFKRTLIGTKIDDIEKIWRKLYLSSYYWGRRGIGTSIISAIEIALWDIKGKFEKKSLYELIGGKKRDKVRIYASGGMQKPIKDLLTEIDSYLEDGFTAVKVRGGYDKDRDLNIIKEIRGSLGYSFDLMLDTGQNYVPKNWSIKEAVELCGRLEEYKLLFIEEPYIADDLKGYGEVKKSVKTPVAMGETGSTIYEFKEYIDNDIADVFQPDATNVGGIGQFLKVAKYAGLHNKTIAPHVFRSGVSFMAHLDLLAVISNALILEFCKIPNPLMFDMLITEPVIKDGYIYPPDEPGLGVYIDEKLLKKYSFKDHVQYFKIEKEQ